MVQDCKSRPEEMSVDEHGGSETETDSFLELESNGITVCGYKTDRIKGLVWEKDGFLLLYKQLEHGKFVWPRNESEVQALPQQFLWLMEGLTTIPKKAVRPVETPFIIPSFVSLPNKYLQKTSLK